LPTPIRIRIGAEAAADEAASCGGLVKEKEAGTRNPDPICPPWTIGS
jgi:hypothetical protein